MYLTWDDFSKNILSFGWLAAVFRSNLLQAVAHIIFSMLLIIDYQTPILHLYPKIIFPTIHHTSFIYISQKNDSQQLDPLNWNNGAQHWPYLQNINPDPIFFHGKLRAVIPTPKSMVKDSCGWHETRQEPGVRALGGSFTVSKIGFNNPWRKNEDSLIVV